MRFTQDLSSGLNLIRAHAPGELKINDRLFHAPVIVSPERIVAVSVSGDAESLDESQAAPLLALDPELVLIGTGLRQLLPARGFRAQFLAKGIGIEVMNTGAACRTFNLLASERRRVVALLWP